MDASGRFKTDTYLERIGIGSDDLPANEETLWRLQHNHLLSVPFENLDIYWKRPIAIDIERFFHKIVTGRRGGFCYELNGLFNDLLRSLGFETKLISGRVYNGSGHGPEFDHAAIIVSIGDNEYLADVGFGDFVVEPLRFALDVEQEDTAGTFMIRRFDGEYLEVVRREGDEWASQYIFTDTPRALSDFEEMCAYQQYSSHSHFTKGALCSILTGNDRKTLTDKKLIITTTDQRHEQPVESESEFHDLLKMEFGIDRPRLAERS